MTTNQKLSWLKRVLAVKVVLTLFVWGLPPLLAPMSLFRALGVPVPDDTTFVRLAGAAIVAIGVGYWYAYRDPVRNIAILKLGVVDNGLAALVIIGLTALNGLSSVFLWVTALLTFIFFIAFILLMPKTEAA